MSQNQQPFNEEPEQSKSTGSFAFGETDEAKGKIPQVSRKPLSIFEENLEGKREKTRSQLAIVLVGSVVGSGLLTFGLAIAGFFTPMDEKKQAFAKDMATLVITTQAALVGSALGFYFPAIGMAFSLALQQCGE
jgi:hypothetical protein